MENSTPRSLLGTTVYQKILMLEQTFLDRSWSQRASESDAILKVTVNWAAAQVFVEFEHFS